MSDGNSAVDARTARATQKHGERSAESNHGIRGIVIRRHDGDSTRMHPLPPPKRATLLVCSTSFDIADHRTTRTLGIVRGITVRSPNVFQGIAAGIQSIFGGEISEYTKVCEATREQAFTHMMAHAQQLGANAIVGVRYDASTLANTTEVLCYGTAVVIEPM